MISVANAFELHLVLTGKRLRHLYDGLLQEPWIELRPVTVEHLNLAREAHDRFGRGSHPARLNFGDCFAYALAKATGYPLLFKGNDFSQTDVRIAIV